MATDPIKHESPSTPPSVPPDVPDKKLFAWLKAQATKLKNLEAKSHRLKLDFVRNANQKGTILLKVRERLAGTSERFETWMNDNTDIGHSTALLWMDVASNYEDVKHRFADSNPLELTVRLVRDAIRDARQERGEGKPGSGRRKATTGATPPTAESGDDGDADTTGTDEKDVAKEGENPTGVDIEDKNHKKLMDRFGPGGDMHIGSPTTKADKPSSYRVTVVTPDKADLKTFGELLPSPITDFNATALPPGSTSRTSPQRWRRSPTYSAQSNSRK